MYVCMYVCMYVSASECSAQSTSVFVHNPKMIFGYAVLDPTEHPGVNEWEVEVNLRVFDDSVGYTDRCVYSNSLVGLNYDKIPVGCFDYTKGHHVLHVSGIDRSGNVIVSEELDLTDMLPPVAAVYNSDLEWPCVGNNYSWKIVANRKMEYQQGEWFATSTGYLTLNPNYRVVDPNTSLGTPYYMYLTPQDYDEFTNTQAKWSAFKANHGLGFMNDNPHDLPFDNDELAEANIYKFIKLENVDISHQLTGFMGQYVTGQLVYGVQKTLGPWTRASYGGIIQTLLGSTPSIHGSWDIQAAMQTMNNYSQAILDGTYPELICSGNSMPDPTPPTPSQHSRFLYCMSKTNWDQDFYLAYQSFRECLLKSPKPLFERDTALLRMDITCLSPTNSGSHGTSISINTSEFIDESGNIIAPTFTLEPGLYSFATTTNDKAYMYFVTEITRQITSSLEISDLVEATIRPVPIIDNYFYVDIYSPFTTEAVYELYDFSGKLIHSEPISIRDGNNSWAITPSNPIPNGFLVNRIKFSDSSVITIHTQKQ